jgi:hypothetical protein
MQWYFAVNVTLSQFAPDEEFVQDETSAFISAIARYKTGYSVKQ